MKKEKALSPVFCLFAGMMSIIFLTMLDQYTKILAVRHLREKEPLVLIDGVLELKYLENRGIAFGLFQGKISIFVVLCLLFFAAAIYLFRKIPKTTYYLPLICILFLMVSGAAGNFIDRTVRGAVVDFIYVSLIDFPIFNLADVYVVCSGILLILFVCLKYEDEDFGFIRGRKD